MEKELGHKFERAIYLGIGALPSGALLEIGRRLLVGDLQSERVWGLLGFSVAGYIGTEIILGGMESDALKRGFDIKYNRLRGKRN